LFQQITVVLFLQKLEIGFLQSQWAGEMKNSAEKLGIKINGAYVCPNEHIFYFILESDSLMTISEFLKPPMLTHHTAKITPILTIEETVKGSTLLKS
jgi:hypothetical protein